MDRIHRPEVVPPSANAHAQPLTNVTVAVTTESSKDAVKGSHRTIRLGRVRYPLVLPRLRDPRLQLSAVIVSVHIIGVLALGFRVSLPQILAALIACALIEMILVFRKARQIAWPASALLTGSGVALILRIPGSPRFEPWSTSSWYLFAAVAAGSLLTKYLIQWRGAHLFNPSNIGLVIVFLLLGAERVEPLDFWWAPFKGWMIVAYAIIITGGVLITARLGLLSMGVTFWCCFALGLGVLALSGHCMTAAWTLEPVCGMSFWTVVVTSPEVLVFLFFMLTDPKTIPSGRALRMVFASMVALVGVLLIAPQSTEFGAKVGLLASLALLTPARFVLAAVFDSERDGPWLIGTRSTGAVTSIPGLMTVAIAAGALVAASIVIVWAGRPAREPSETFPGNAPPSADVVIDSDTVPRVTVGEDVVALNSGLGGQPEALVLDLLENLEIENQAISQGSLELLHAADHGYRLTDMEAVVKESLATGKQTITAYKFDSLYLFVVYIFGGQGGPSVGVKANGTVERITFDRHGAELARAAGPNETAFVLRQATGSRWLIVGTLP